jgi:hypothetical protein
MESHLEMDGAWALYECWLKVLTGEAEVAGVRLRQIVRG